MVSLGSLASGFSDINRFSGRWRTYANARMHGCTDARMHGCTDARMHGCTDARMHGYKAGKCEAARAFQVGLAASLTLSNENQFLLLEPSSHSLYCTLALCSLTDLY